MTPEAATTKLGLPRFPRYRYLLIEGSVSLLYLGCQNRKGIGTATRTEGGSSLILQSTDDLSTLAWYVDTAPLPHR